MADGTRKVRVIALGGTIAMARLILPTDVSVQAPPNLADAMFPRLLEAGINDWGGISPVTPDHVNPERPWPAVDKLRAATEAAGRRLVARLRHLSSLPALLSGHERRRNR